MIVSVVLLATALMTGSPFVSWLLYFFAFTTLVLPRLTKAAFGALTLRYDLSHPYTFPGEEVEAVVSIGQPLPLPLPWLEVREPLSYPLQSVTPLSVTLALRGKGTAVLTHRFRCQRRGIYSLGSVEMAAGDWLGLERYRRRWMLQRTFVCFPTVYPLDTGPFPRHLPFGPSIDRHSPFHDPHETVRLRPYLAGNPIRSVAWKASARQGRWMVKEDERVREGAIALFLNANRNDFQSLPASAGIERAVSVAASLLWAERDSGRAVGLFAYGGNSPIRFPPGEGVSIRLQLLRALAGFEGGDHVSFAPAWERDGATLPPGTTVVAIVPHLTVEIDRAAASIARRGSPVVILALEEPREGRFWGRFSSEGGAGATGTVAGVAGVRLWKVIVEGGVIRFA